MMENVLDNCSNSLNNNNNTINSNSSLTCANRFEDAEDIDIDYSSTKCVLEGETYLPIISKLSTTESNQSTSSSIDSSCDSDYYPLNHLRITNGIINRNKNGDYVNTGSPKPTHRSLNHRKQHPPPPPPPLLPPSQPPIPPPPIYANLPLVGSTITGEPSNSADSTNNYSKPQHHHHHNRHHNQQQQQQQQQPPPPQEKQYQPFHRRNHSLTHRFNNNSINNHYHMNHHSRNNHYHNVIISSSSSSSSSSYPSSPSSISCSPPVPETGTDPNRVLLNHWSEYIHLSGRKYYYNSVTKQSSWKPPRRGLPIFRDEDENTSHSEENLTDSSSANSWSPTINHSHDTLSISSDFSSSNTMTHNNNTTLSSSIGGGTTTSSNIYSHRLKPRVRPRKTILGNLWQSDNNKNDNDDEDDEDEDNVSPYSVPPPIHHHHHNNGYNNHYSNLDYINGGIDNRSLKNNHNAHKHHRNHNHHHHHRHRDNHDHYDENNPPPPPPPHLPPHHHDTWSSPLSTGWKRYINDNQVYFVNDVTKVKSDRDCQSQSDASESYSPITKDLPENGHDIHVHGVTTFSSSKPAAKKPPPPPLGSLSSASSVSRIKNDGSLRLPMKKHYVNSFSPSPIDRSYKAKSMVFLPTSDKFISMDSDTEDRSSISTMNTTITSPISMITSSSATTSPTTKTSKLNFNNHKISLNHTINGSLNHHPSTNQQTPPIPENLEESRAFKTGILNRTKIMENGKRLRKNWSTSLVALSDYYLLIFKDAKINSHQEENLKPEIVIELGGSLIEWSQGLSSRKNVFQLTTFTGNQILLQEDCSLTAAEWFYSIKSAISKLPQCDGTATIGSNNSLETNNKDCKLKRSKSTKQTCKKLEINQKLSTKNGANGSGDDKITPEKKKKIRERLINFLLRRPTLDSLREKGIFKDGPVFGCDLYSLCSREKQLIPKVVQQCIKAIEQKGLKADGIYRVCGNLSEVQKIRYQVNHDNYEGIWAQEDVHVLTGALKLFFRDMKEPLFPCNRFDSLMFTIGLPDKKRKQEAIVRVIRDLPRCNKETLRYLLKHLLRVQDHKDENRMHIQNLAIVFGPTLMWPETDSNNLAYDMMLKMHSNQVIELLLLEFDQIFT
ncbi:myb-like protein A isoform X2 [Panonychus citri]|uniref:myb-like protein A isoform X2 n=1 Tax=Panonychus citri TaxID=50023 RepID=UPI0023082413|nr:myb-like protein A isoform X2 [Panonychus citri]